MGYMCWQGIVEKPVDGRRGLKEWQKADLADNSLLQTLMHHLKSYCYTPIIGT
jgi:hypothetical protein